MLLTISFPQQKLKTNLCSADLDYARKRILKSHDYLM